jgi:hypothetical protein
VRAERAGVGVTPKITIEAPTFSSQSAINNGKRLVPPKVCEKRAALLLRFGRGRRCDYLVTPPCLRPSKRTLLLGNAVHQRIEFASLRTL